MTGLFDFVFHIDTHLQRLIQGVGAWSYLIIFGFLFAETGFIVTPFLPGDSLIFVTGALAAKGIPLNLPVTYAVMCAAAVLGDSVNFEIGKRLGPSVFQKRIGPLNPDNLQRTQDFFKNTAERRSLSRASSRSSAHLLRL